MECDCGLCDGGGFFDTGDAVSGGLGLGLGFMFAPYMFAMLSMSKKTGKTVIVCLNCGGKNIEEFKFCGHCGHALYPPTKTMCPKCATQVPKLSFCQNCGSKLEQ